MEFPELSLAPSVEKNSNNYVSVESVINLPMKRKQDMIQECIDLQLKDPLPLDWGQCLDLESERMYYQNRKTFRKTSDGSKDQKLDLELNISSSFSQQQTMENQHYSKKQISSSKSSSSSSDLLAILPCSNCHLLVIVSQSSPSCPNCKYVDHSLLKKF